MRIYLVVIDDSPESRIALRFAARRAVKTGGGVEILTLLPPQEFIDESGLRPAITVREGDGPKVIRELIAANPEIAALVLGAAASGAPGKLVSHFSGTDAGALPVPIMIVPGSLTLEAIDRLS